MKTQDLKKRFPDLVIAKLKMDAVYCRRDIEEKMKKFYGNSIVRIEHSGTNICVASSAEYGSFISQLKPGVKVIMTGGEIYNCMEYEHQVWTITNGPSFMCGGMVVWLDGFSGAYSCEHLKLANQ